MKQRLVRVLPWVLVIATFLALLPPAVYSQVNKVSVNQIVGILTGAKGGTGSGFFTVAGPTAARTYTFADATGTVLSKAVAPTNHGVLLGTGTALAGVTAVCGTGSILFGQVGADPICSTSIWPNAATQGDLLAATSANTVGSIAAVASGQLLQSAGTSTLPAYTANPSVTTMTVKGGGGTGTLKASGTICNTTAADCGAVAYSDAGVINQWNVMSLTLPASTLATNGDTLKVRIVAQLATNANTKGWQLWFGGGTCSGTNASCCTTGTQIFSDGSASSNVTTISDYYVTRTSSGNQQVNGVTFTGATSIQSIDNVSTAITDTGTIPIVYCARNVSAGAATLQGTPAMRVDYLGK
jgi:hypothetical protein